MAVLRLTLHDQALSCTADIAPHPNGNGEVNVDDLLLVINNWGPCPTSGACKGDARDEGVKVDVDDLLEVINQWGSCGSQSTGPQTISDCYDVFCDGLQGQDWQDCIDGCIQMVCENNPSECE